MDHRMVLKAFEAHVRVESMRGGYLHTAQRGKKVVYWISRWAHAGDVIHTGMFTKAGNAVEASWPDELMALRFLGCIKGKAR